MATTTIDSTIPSNVRHIRPPMITYKPSMWGDIFSTFSFDDQLQAKYSEEIEALKKKATSMLMASTTSTKIMTIIDKLERLGVAYHFETEIEHQLKQVYDSFEKKEQDYDLFTTALRFRLLRQHQYHVSCNVFDKFVEKDNKWKESLSSDVEGLLSLYEAAHIRIRDEHILDEAVAFTVHHLTLMLPILESTLKERVQQALKRSVHRNLPLYNIRFYVSVFGRDGSTEEFIVKLAKFNFNFLQNIYRKELNEVTRWWDKFDLKSKLPYARDRLVECYFWGTAFCYQPQYSYVRIAVAKNMQMATVIDDTYDNYGTLEEDDLFTEILERWNLDEIDILPDFMKVVYRFIMSVFEDYKDEAEKQEKSFVLPYYIEAVKQLCRAFNKEQKWIMERQMPPYDEYMTNSVITTCIYVTVTAIVPGMQSVTEEDVQWILSEPKLVISTTKMGRVLQDIGSHERENREGKLLTVVDCYMKDKGVTKEEALSKFVELVEDGWKDINEEWVKEGSSKAKELVQQLLNFGCAAELTYNNNEDGYTDPNKYFGPLIAALYVDPLLI